MQCKSPSVAANSRFGSNELRPRSLLNKHFGSIRFEATYLLLVSRLLLLMFIIIASVFLSIYAHMYYYLHQQQRQQLHVGRHRRTSK